ADLVERVAALEPFDRPGFERLVEVLVRGAVVIDDVPLARHAQHRRTQIEDHRPTASEAAVVDEVQVAPVASAAVAPHQPAGGVELREYLDAAGTDGDGQVAAVGTALAAYVTRG